MRECNSRELKKKFGEVLLAKVLRDGNLLVVVKSEEQKNKVLSTESICKKIVQEWCWVLGDSKVTRGVISGIPVEEDLEKLKWCIQGGEVSRVKRLLQTVNGDRVSSFSVLLEFEGTVLPDRVKIWCMSFPVRVFVPPPLRCYKWQRYGHIAVVCKEKQKCLKCGGEHRFEKCGDNVLDKCSNCGGQHRLSFRSCEVRKKAVRRVQRGGDGPGKDQTGLPRKLLVCIGLTQV